MDAADIATINDWFNTHSRNSFQMPDPAGDRALEAAVDAPRINREVLVYVLAQLGNSANAWQYVLQFNGHIGVFHPESNVKQAKGLIDELEREAKAQLGLEGYPLLEPMDMEDYKEALEDLAKRYPENERQRATGSGCLSDVLDLLDRTCNCWLPQYVIRALHRSGNFLKPDAARRKSVDLELWRWNSQPRTPSPSSMQTSVEPGYS